MDEKIIEKYIWGSSDNACAACGELDEKEFKTIEEIPDKPHPNCKCILREVEGEVCDYCIECLDKMEEMIGDAESLKFEVEIEINDIERIEEEYSGIDLDDVVRLLNDIRSLINPFYTLSRTIGIFISNYFALLEAQEQGLGGTDKYYHAKANCEAAQKGILGSKIAEGLSNLKELADYYDNLYVEKKTLEETLKDSDEDQEANREGRDLGRKYPTKSPGELLKHRRPDKLKEKYW
ncbi:MAG: hypothetical protein A2Y25_12055 [Candidatus Melainabacteria bacterium GWF2_37_15]|nr:MAG: hypothetical protein A2Y25_12055 [Candidatus Melainabacteria bacterium GWF2_37_15]